MDRNNRETMEVKASKVNVDIEKRVVNKLTIVLILCVIFMISEIIGGYLANSLAILCDASHLLSDLGGFVISLVSSFLATFKPTKNMNFGFRRVEVLGALTSIICIWLLSGFLVYMAINRIMDDDFEIDAQLMIIMASMGLIINSLMAIVLSYSSHSTKSTADQHEPQHTRRTSCFVAPKIIDSKMAFASDRISVSKLSDFASRSNISILNDNQPQSPIEVDKVGLMVSRNINIRAAFIHIVGDLIQSFGVLIASVIIYFNPNLKVVDPICSVVFSVIVLITTLPILLDILYVLSESFPKQLDYDELKRQLASVDGVCEVLDLKVWSLSVDHYLLNVKILLDNVKLVDNLGQINAQDIRRIMDECKLRLGKDVNYLHVNIEIDLGGKPKITKNNSDETFVIGRFSVRP